MPKLWLLFFLTLIVISGCAGQPDARKQQFRAVDSLFTTYQSDDKPGAAVMIIHKQRLIYQKGFGLANVELMRPINSSTNFRLASISKQFTAIAILQLIENGQLSFNTQLAEIFTQLPAIYAPITINHLLKHTSGLVDYESLVPDEQHEQIKDEDVFTLITNHPSLYFSPGEKFQYSNSGYALLALIVEKVSGKTFSDYLKHHIFIPVGMNTSVAYDKSIHTINERAFGYSIETNNQPVLNDQSNTSGVLGDGGIYSNLDDLYLWDKALYNYQLLGPELTNNLFTDQKNAAGETIHYGYGWRLEQFEGHEVSYHTGVSRGFRNIFYRIAEQQFTVVVLTNRNSYVELTPHELAQRVTLIMLGTGSLP